MKKNRIGQLALHRETLRNLQASQFSIGRPVGDNPSSTVCVECPDTEPSWCIICYKCTADRCNIIGTIDG